MASSFPSSHRTGARPLLGVIACNRILGEERAASVMRRYLVAASYMDASVVIVPSLPELVDAVRLASTVDGLLLTGSPSNISGRFYGEENATGEGPFDEERDEVVRTMIGEASKAGKPILGICRGLQEINVALGGTLRRDLAVSSRELEHHAPSGVDLDAMFGLEHEVSLREDGVLAHILGTTHMKVNSVHYQGIDRLAPGATVEATAPDGVVEALSARLGSSAVLAVQWHPEWRTERNRHSQNLFRAFGQVLRGQGLPGFV
ncbi:gamma-glutamyl-gamma-aminobutyrate hydrolase family protein [Microvirga thermotolerans]|uniref:Gamma-glutamyl-gamma-aminobutyrate hydrolase family protein n=1 Tax=Microvirga thermotolerans TaxID=2651334 RepID=A0A5P9K0I5_9HYPH|nr:gamma-glutamyl-gamma-aminobutyrate hydrolase family protein [Microvirga thermotolerans]QFU17518.1 gamma-glutamyl-gamma-aminobutyrate hydrolase family protein [Microvirga thermotolerans]